VMKRGDERTRTADPLLAKQVLYQLSYVPRGVAPPFESSEMRSAGTLRADDGERVDLDQVLGTE
jgi:hypothetical protein